MNLRLLQECVVHAVLVGIVYCGVRSMFHKTTNVGHKVEGEFNIVTDAIMFLTQSSLIKYRNHYLVFTFLISITASGCRSLLGSRRGAVACCRVLTAPPHERELSLNHT